MNILLSLLFSCFILFGQKTVSPKTDERVLAYIEIVEIGQDVYVRTSYDTRIFPSECAAKHVVAGNYLKTCVMDTTIRTKTKKL